MPALIDLDKLAPLDLSVKLGGKTYRVPGDPPSEWYLQITQLASGAAGDADDATQLGMLQGAICDLLAIRQPAVANPGSAAHKALRKGLSELGLITTLKVIGAIYADLSLDGDEGEPDPPKPSRGAGTTRRSAKGRSRTNSRSTS